METLNQIAFTMKAKANEREVTPQTIGFSMFNQFNVEVEEFLGGSQRRTPLDDVRFEIKEGSYKLLLLLPVFLASTVEPDMRKLHRQDSLSDIDPKRAEIVKQWQRRARSDRNYQVFIESLDHSFAPILITSETDYRAPDADNWVAVEKYLVGRVVDMGGTTAANVHLVNEDTGKRIVASSSEGFLKEQRENYLYRTVQVHVSAMENVKTGEMKNIRLLSFVGEGPSYDEAELEAAIDKGTQAWAQVPDAAAWLRKVRGEDE